MMMATRRAKRPLNEDAVKKANDAVRNMTKPPGRPLDPKSPKDAALRKEWMDAYIAAGGEIERPTSIIPLEETVSPCPPPPAGSPGQAIPASVNGATGSPPTPAQSQAGVYRQNRQLNPEGKTSGLDPVEHPVSHTFIYTTNPDGTLANTYSWGNDYEANVPSHWYQDRDEDMDAARKAIQQRREYEAASWYKKPFMPDNFGESAGGPELIPHVGQAFRNLRDDPNSPSAHSNWLVTNNCKTEATRLTDEAIRLQQQTPNPPAGGTP